MSKRARIAVLCNVEGLWGPASGTKPADAWAYKHAASGQYIDAVVGAGGTPLLVPCVDDETLITDLLSACDGVLITGGADVAPRHYAAEPARELGTVNPLRDALDRVVVDYTRRNPDLPVLAICRGIQAYNVFAGGTLVQDIASEVPAALQHSQKAPGWEASHSLEILEPDSIVASLFDEERPRVNSFHHQAVKQPGEGLKVVARAPDGVIEAMEWEEARWCVLVQWHPEHMVARHEHARRLFELFVQACGK